jgi:hypothetical protein
MSGRRSKKNVTTVKIRMHTHNGDYSPIVPVSVPDINEVKTFAQNLHQKGQAWNGEAFGWPAEYNPEKTEPPIDSNMTFTPADFCIGESGIWFFSLMWENGKDVEPVDFLDDRNIVEEVV